jgi:hypothetical protein
MTTEMKQTICPACGCQIVDSGYERNGVRYCCEACATGSTTNCKCGCCHPQVGT